MVKQVNKIRDAIFIVVEERSCPIYNVGDELKVENSGISVPSFKPCCLYLGQKIFQVVTSKASFGGFARFDSQRSRFDCGGCEGMIYFEFKKEKDFATRQMKLLNEMEEKRRRQHLDKFFGILRNIDLFEPLDDDALVDLTLLLDMKSIPIDKVLLKKGDPGIGLFIVLKGSVAVIADDGSKIIEMGPGEIFGEMSLLSGEPVTNSVHTTAATQIAMLSVKNFKHVLKKYPVLQLFLFKLLVGRAQTLTLRSGIITSGMSGELAEISVVDLFQLINSSQKTGKIELSLDQGRAEVFFKEGEIVRAGFLDLRDKEAVFELLTKKRGHFAYSKGIPQELRDLPSIGGFMGVMMEGVQRIDEQ